MSSSGGSSRPGSGRSRSSNNGNGKNGHGKSSNGRSTKSHGRHGSKGGSGSGGGGSGGRPPSGDTKKKRKKRRSKVLSSCVRTCKPTNVERERDAFYAVLDEEPRFRLPYSPQFEYNASADVLGAVLARHGTPSEQHLALAEGILDRTIARHDGSYARFERATGGRVLTNGQVRRRVRAYLARLKRANAPGSAAAQGLQSVRLRFAPTLVARASVKCKSKLGSKIEVSVRIGGAGDDAPSPHRERWFGGTLNHECGTHLLRRCNDRVQPWAGSGKRDGKRPADVGGAGGAGTPRQPVNFWQNTFSDRHALHLHS